MRRAVEIAGYVKTDRRLWMLSLCFMLLLGVAAEGYEQPFPHYITADITWKEKDREEETERTVRGQLWFKDLPVLDSRGRVRGFGKPGYYTGIKWFVPKRPGEIWITRSEKNEDPRTFLLHDHFGEQNIVVAFDRIDVFRTMEATMTGLMDKSADELTVPGVGTKDAALLEELDIDEAPRVDMITPETSHRRKRRKKDVPESERPSPLRFAMDKDIGIARIPVADVLKIVFQKASDGLQREGYVGRYVQYSRAATGDGGRVQVKTATFFGGEDGNERFTYGDFLDDGSILLAGNFIDLGFVDPKKITVLGKDPAGDAYPNIEHTDRRGRKRLEELRRTATLVFFSDDLTRLIRVVRLPWGTGTVGSVAPGSDGAIYLSGRVGPHFDVFARDAKVIATVENPEAIAAAKASRRKREPGPDGYVLKLAPDGSNVPWVVRFKHAGLNLFRRPDRKLLVRRGNDLFFITPEGVVSQGPEIETTGHNMAVDPRTGDMYFGGSYRSGTGLEPYVNPYIYRVDADGKQVWTGYGWSGPIVGVEPLRLVSDSSVNRIQVGEDGSLTLTGWSDGGNTVLSYQPYDLRKTAPGGGFASSVWGATGGLTVRIGHIIHMDGETMHVDYCTKYVSYLPTSDVPTLLNIYDVQGLPNGDVAVTGASRTGYIETHDAWITPWWIERRTNEFAQAKSGAFFTLFRPDFNRPRMATRTPGISRGQLAARGNLLLLYSGATGNRQPEGVRTSKVRQLPIVKRAIQPENGGGLDGFAMLIDTQEQPNPPVIPGWTWDDHDKKKGRRR